ncbi:sugar lactone lactonase YvrE [Neorhizobium sp. R1-B]|uniref:SMP-30/gluconolactonase/LRE family protein n=1 Tax=Neorhizobium sp. R1-B TaxID=2485162 RepID=UPI00106679DE|nr:SMP-30/gluconolactonase/LRE family protein [Neorhizobium sp. R1-B]TDX70383.1 sugar lactone lactonase YvrE [Neorhizobium sp. R1-B]
MINRFEKVTACQNRVGESPVWDADRSTLFWTDVHAQLVYALQTSSGEIRHWSLPARIGSFGLTDDDRLIVALTTGVHLFDPASGDLEFLVDPEPHRTSDPHKNRLNDSKIGPDGAYWVGSMHEDGLSAALYRVTANGSAEAKIEGLGTVNGLAFSADGRTLYLSDSKQCWIDRYDLNPSSGAISNRRRIAAPDERLGRPDGAATDMAGDYWSAGVSAGVLNRFSASGELLQSIRVPPLHPTMPCFGGEDLRSLYFTSLRRPDAASPDCGDVFMMRVDVPGVPIGRFKTTP